MTHGTEQNIRGRSCAAAGVGMKGGTDGKEKGREEGRKLKDEGMGLRQAGSEGRRGARE